MIRVMATKEILEDLDKVKSFRNSLTGDTGINDDKQRYSEFAERSVAAHFQSLGLTWRWAQNTEEANFFDILCGGVRIDVKDSSHPQAKYIIYPYLKRKKLMEDAGKSVDWLIATNSALYPFYCDIVCAISVKQFIAVMRIKDDSDDVPLRNGTMYVPYDEAQHIEDFIEHLKVVDNRTSRFVHYCHCGRWGSFGYGVNLRAGQEGTWYCREHRPQSNV